MYTAQISTSNGLKATGDTTMPDSGYWCWEPLSSNIFNIVNNSRPYPSVAAPHASETSSGAAPHAYPERCTIIRRVFSLPIPVRQGRWLSWRPEVKDMLLWFISVPGLRQGLLTVLFMLVGQTGSLLF
ncbi:hypothetical protein B0H13DRAFT_2273504 [Mycena leptocephala]|nr:hypothetical protein B0H13DRAFT_2273504 [Mycena leptocephala]